MNPVLQGDLTAIQRGLDFLVPRLMLPADRVVHVDPIKAGRQPAQQCGLFSVSQVVQGQGVIVGNPSQRGQVLSDNLTGQGQGGRFQLMPPVKDALHVVVDRFLTPPIAYEGATALIPMAQHFRGL